MRGFSFTCRKKMTLTRWVAFTSCFVFEAAMENGYGSSPSRAITLQANCIPCQTMSNNVKHCQTMSQNDAEFLSLSSQIEKVFNCAMQTALHLTTPDSLRTSGYLGLFQAEAARDTGHAGPTCWTCRLGGKNASRFVSGTEFATATNSTKQKQSKT